MVLTSWKLWFRWSSENNVDKISLLASTFVTSIEIVGYSMKYSKYKLNLNELGVKMDVLDNLFGKAGRSESMLE